MQFITNNDDCHFTSITLSFMHLCSVRYYYIKFHIVVHILYGNVNGNTCINSLVRPKFRFTIIN